MKEKFINQYPISKTLQFSLIPVGKTEENFEKKLLLEQDEKRAEDYQTVKGYIDRYHKVYIEKVLSQFKSSEFDALLMEYAQLYYKQNKDDKDKKDCQLIEGKLRKIIAESLTSDKVYKDLFKEKLIKELLPSILREEKERETVQQFERFTTYFTGFHQNRRNMYSAEDHNTSIAHRCINDNLPKFLDNCLSFKKVASTISAETFETMNREMLEAYGVEVSDAFCLNFYFLTLPQSGIDKYNGILGGYTFEDGTKVKGLNEYINLYNQQIDSSDKSKKLPLMKPLYKQILSDRESVSFVPEKFVSDEELINAIDNLYKNVILNTLIQVEKTFKNFASFNMAGVYITAGISVTNISNLVFGSWDVLINAWKERYETLNPYKPGKDIEKYREKEHEEYKRNKSFSVLELQELGTLEKGSIPDYFTKSVQEIIESIKATYNQFTSALVPYREAKKLNSDSDSINLIKQFLDSIKNIESLLKPLLGTGKEDQKDEVFYGEFLPLYNEISTIDRMYDKVRNYITQKPYSTDKIKLNFENPQLLGGWDKNKECEYRTVLLRKDSLYYLAIMDKSNSKAFEEIPVEEGECYQKMNYKLLPSPYMSLPKVFFAKSNIEYYCPSKEIIRINETKSYTKGNFNSHDCLEYIDFLKSSINKNEDWAKFNFKFSPTSSYKDVAEFYKEVHNQGYSVTFSDVPTRYIDQLVEVGDLYLFQIYNKDFSSYSKGTPNLHTLYFQMLFDERNLNDLVYQLNGGAEMFFRKPSINDAERIIHPANNPIPNKNPENSKKTSTFEYDLVKNKRFTRRQFSLHVPITMNYKAEGQNKLNLEVRKELKAREHQFIIGIDRGERNLIYICVINENGQIVEQMSLNEIIGDNGYKVDYRNLLERKEEERDKAQKSWGTIENIKELKAGYMSQVVHKICDLVVKYDAVIAMEDLNSGFMNSRVKVDKQVYQKFEKALTEKLNYLVDKKLSPDADGGLLRAYQLTNKADGIQRGIQDGIIFYIPAWNTSKIDPTTGFVDLLKPKYTSINAAQEFFGRFDDIFFDQKKNMFAFRFKYSKFPTGCAAGDSIWTVYTNETRIQTFRNPQKNNEWDNQEIKLNEAFVELFNMFHIDYTTDLKEQILKQRDAEFYKRLIKLLALTLQMRNSITGRTDVDYIISPILNAEGVFYCSNDKSDNLPNDADANGAYNIARKVLWAINVLKNTQDEELGKAKLSISNKEWLAYAIQDHE